jgi:trimeric autotransporter adhesin
MALHVFVIKETELEGPQDLRAESGKCPNSTNERKNMSTKTLRKRIALVAVSALGAGLLSVVAVPSANAADGTITGTAGSIGLLAGPSAGTTTRTAVLLSTGTLVVVGTDASVAVVSAGAAVVASSGGTVTADQTCGTIVTGGSGSVSIRPTGAVGSTFTVTTYNENACADAATVADIITVTIAGSSVAGALSVANSTVTFQDTDAANGTTDDVGADKTTVGLPLFLNVALADAYKAPITSTSGALVVTVSAGAVVQVSAGATAVPNDATFTQAVSSASPADINIQVNEKTVGAGWSGTITVTYNGVVVATRSGTITGAPAKITITPKKVGKNDGAATAAAFDYTVADLAGNALVLPFADLGFSSSSNTGVVSTAAGSVVNTTSAAGKGTITCVSGAVGSSSVVVQTILSNGSIVKSNAATFNCGGAAASYTASFDKASYAQGEIAKLTVSFKDAKGAAANSIDTVTTWVSATDLGRTITTPMLTAVDANPTASETVDVNGNIVYTFTVGTTTGLTEGSYNAVVSFPKQSLAANQTATYKVTAGGAVSNADVLKAIVSLIASINKQIAALQKALLRR